MAAIATPESLPQWPQLSAFCITLTQRVGIRLLQVRGQTDVEEKGDGSLVTGWDQWADGELRGAIAAQYPHHGLLTEETSHVFPPGDWCWIIDPIDGTTNFSRGIPLWGISLGLLYRGVPVFGHVDFPPLGQCFQGYWPGASGLPLTPGAWLNHQPIRTRPDDPGPQQFFSLCARSTAILQQPFPCKVRMLGSAAYNLLLVAAGYAVGAVEATPKVWDIAGVWPILQAAGVSWTALDDQAPFPLTVGENYRDLPFPTLVTSRPDLVSQFRPLVQSVAQGSDADPKGIS